MSRPTLHAACMVESGALGSMQSGFEGKAVLYCLHVLAGPEPDSNVK